MNPERTCTRCDGSGLDPQPEADMDCGACDGTGTAPYVNEMAADYDVPLPIGAPE